MRIVAIDFDGTIVEDKYPEIGTLIPEAKKYINKLRADGYEVIIWTTRTHLKLLEAIEFLAKEGIKYNGINQSSQANLMMYNGQDSRKIFADMYIDDRGLLSPMPPWSEIYDMIIDRIPLYADKVIREGHL